MARQEYKVFKKNMGTALKCPESYAASKGKMDNNVLVAAGVGVAMLGGLFVFMSGKRKGPVCLPECSLFLLSPVAPA